MQNKHIDLRTLTQLALLVAIELVMKATGLGSVPVGPLYMSFLTLPIAVGAMLLGPGAGAVLGAVFGLVSFKDAVTGVSAMTGSFFQISPLHTLILCVATRVLMGSWSYTAGALSAPLLNTLFFMGYICLFFYQTDYVQNIVAAKGVSNPLSFVIALVGVQGLVEAGVVGVVGTIVAKVVDMALHHSFARAA